MNAMTPRQAAARALTKTNDLEEAYLAGYEAEGLIGMGRMPPSSVGDKVTIGHEQSTARAGRPPSNQPSCASVIRKHLRSGPMTISQLMKIMPDRSRSSIKMALQRLHHDGLVVSTGKYGNVPAVYRLTHKGKVT